MRVLKASLGSPGTASPYYPPRARWYSGLGNVGYRVRRQLHLDALRQRSKITASRWLLSVALPGYSCFGFGRRLWGQAILVAYCLSAVVFLIWLGHVAAHLAMGAMISLHVFSQLRLLERWPGEMSPRRRIATSFGIFLATSLLIYAPLRVVLERCCFLPLRVQDRVVVISPRASAEGVRRGDLVAYRIRSASVGNVRLRAGYGMGRIEAVAGEWIRFDEDTYTVSGVTRPRRAHMPQNLGWAVPQNHWFIWPDSAIKASGNGNVSNVPQVLQELALVPESEYVGKPFKRWFGRRQVEP